MSADVRQALVEAPIGLSRDQLFAQTGAPDDRKFGALLSQLKGCGKIKVGGTRNGEPYFVLAEWPESALREHFDPHKPTQRRLTVAEHMARREAAEPKKREPEKNGAEFHPLVRPDIPVEVSGAGAAHFAISSTGELGIEKGEVKLKLTRAELVALLAFTEKTEEVWK